MNTRHEEMTHVLFGEGSGEAQIAGHLRFEQTIFPQVCINPICSLWNLPEPNNNTIDFIVYQDFSIW